LPPLALAFAAMAACGGSSSPAPAAAVTVQGTEHFAWNQQAANSDDISRYIFVGYVDDASMPLPDAACRTTSADSQFDCAARLPAMSAGPHRLQVAAAVLVDAVRFEGPRSTVLNVTVVPVTGGSASSNANSRVPFTTADGTPFIAETLAVGLDGPSGLAVTPDGRVLVAERGGAVRVWKEGRIQDATALRLANVAVGNDVGLLGIATHPEFADNGEVYVAYTARMGDDTFTNRVVRFRELNDTLGQPMVLLEDRADAAPPRAPRIRFGPDGKLYVAFPAERAAAENSAAYAGKILRLNDDGTTPRDNAGYTPILPNDNGVPLAFSWQPQTNARWQIDRDSRNDEMLISSRVAGRRMLATQISPSIDPSGAAFYHNGAIAGFTGDLFISALGGRQIERVRFDTGDPSHVVSTEPLLDHIFGRISDIVEGPDGAMYFVTSNRSMGDSSSDDDRLIRIVASSRKKDAGSKIK
jgi:glucose/arabinose dehydrogenase